VQQPGTETVSYFYDGRSRLAKTLDAPKMQQRLNEIGHGTKATTTCDPNADADKINNFAEQRMHDSDRAPYSWNPLHFNTCTSFANDALEAGQQ